MTPDRSAKSRARLTLTTALVAFCPLVALAEDSPSLNLYGVTGLIDMPSGEQQPDARFTATTGHFGPMSRHTLSFQLSPRVSGSFRYQGVRKFDDVVPSPFDVYYDRSFDVRYQLAFEGQYMPAVTVGLQDFIGTGIFAGEYLVATKHLTPKLKVTGGLGWGRYGSYGSIGAPLGDRPSIDVGKGGKPNPGQWFKGDVAPFGGIEYQVNDQWSVKAEYSSDNYDMEAGKRQTFDRKSPLNFGVEYNYKGTMRLGAYYMYGSEFGLSASFLFNPKQRPAGAIGGPAPAYIKARPSIKADPDAWSQDWVTQEGAAPLLMENINKWLKDDKIVIEAIRYSGTTATVMIRNPQNDSEAQAVGRVARAMTQVMPASVEVFEIVPVARGMATSKVTVKRSDLEQLDYAANGGSEMRDRVVFSDPSPQFDGFTRNPDLYPKFSWNLGPYLKTRLFDPKNPLRGAIGLKAAATYDIAPGLVLSGSLSHPILSNLGDGGESSSVLPHVRTDAAKYDADNNLDLDKLTLAYYRQLSPTVYGRVTVGYLESMFGGVSTELLWKRTNSPLALGVEVNYVKQRDFGQMFGFRDYDVVTGHVSGYYTFGKQRDYLAQLDVGRYLAGDYGATLSLDRTFENGWKFGVFATLTDVPFEDYGEGSFDKGIRLEIPMNWFLGTPNRQSNKGTLRPVGRDGGARLEVDGRLYEELSKYQLQGYDEQWGRFWK